MSSSLRRLARASITAAAVVLNLAPSGSALVVQASGEHSTLAPPAPFPGWQHVGRCGQLTAIYLGADWVVTAWHVEMHEIELEGRTYRPVEASRIVLRGAEGSNEHPDLAVFRIEPRPPLPDLVIRSAAPTVGEEVLLVSTGLDGGERLSWRGMTGTKWATGRSKRWGTNRVQEVGRDYKTGTTKTRSFLTVFDPPNTPYEAQAASGDSGGAAFLRSKDGKGWELAGVMYSIAMFPGQPGQSAVPGNGTLVVDLSYYRHQLVDILEGRTRPPAPPPRSPTEDAH